MESEISLRPVAETILDSFFSESESHQESSPKVPELPIPVPELPKIPVSPRALDDDIPERKVVIWALHRGCRAEMTLNVGEVQGSPMLWTAIGEDVKEGTDDIRFQIMKFLNDQVFPHTMSEGGFQHLFDFVAEWLRKFGRLGSLEPTKIPAADECDASIKLHPRDVLSPWELDFVTRIVDCDLDVRPPEDRKWGNIPFTCNLACLADYLSITPLLTICLYTIAHGIHSCPPFKVARIMDIDLSELDESERINFTTECDKLVRYYNGPENLFERADNCTKPLGTEEKELYSDLVKNELQPDSKRARTEGPEAGAEKEEDPVETIPQ